MSVKPTPAGTSVKNQLMELGPGESFSRAKRLDGDESGKAELASSLKKMQQALDPQMARASALTGYKYASESIVSRTRSMDTLVVVVITRLS